MFDDSKTLGSRNPSYGGQARMGQETQEPPYHLFDFVSSITRGVKDFAYVVIDALKGRYDC